MAEQILRKINPDDVVVVNCVFATGISSDLMTEVDWDEGLPLEMMALVAKAGGVGLMDSMREVCKSWQQGFEVQVSSIKIVWSWGDPEPYVEEEDDDTNSCWLLPPGVNLAQRFPGLTKIDLGGSGAPPAWLKHLRAIPRLDSVIIGHSFQQRS